MKKQYTEQEVNWMKDQYSADPSKDTVTKIANELDRSTQSVIAKLSREGVYQKPKATTKTGDAIVKKEEYVRGIEIMLSAKSGELESLEKATKRDLERVMQLLTNMSDSVNAKEGK